MEYKSWTVEQVKMKMEEDFGEDIARKFVGKPYIPSYYLKQANNV